MIGGTQGISNTGDSILVLGAGELGMSILRSLAARAPLLPHIIPTVLLRPHITKSFRKQQDLDELKSLGIKIVFGDVAEDAVADLAALFAQFNTVIGCTGFAAGNGSQRKLAKAALDGVVKRYIPWQFGVDYDVIGRGSAQELFDEQLDVRDLLRSQERTEWIVISTGLFTSFLFEPSFGVVDLGQNTVRALGSWENAITVTAPGDIGTLAREILLADDPRIANEVVFTSGDTITFAKLADIVDAVLGRTVQRTLWSVRLLKDELAQDPDNPIKKYRAVFAEGRGVAWPTENTFNATRGIPVIGVERWLRENLKWLSAPGEGQLGSSADQTDR